MYREILKLRLSVDENEQQLIGSSLQNIFENYNKCARDVMLSNNIDSTIFNKLEESLSYINKVYETVFNVSLYDRELTKEKIISLSKQIILELEEFEKANY